MTLEPTAVFRSSHLCVRCNVTLSQIKAVVGYGALHTSPVVTNQIQQSITQIHTNTSLNPPTYQQTHWYTQWSHFTSDFLCSNSRWHLNRETVKTQIRLTHWEELGHFHSLYLFPPKNVLCMIYKRFKLWGHWKCPHKSPSPCNTYVIPMSLYKFVSS